MFHDLSIRYTPYIIRGIPYGSTVKYLYTVTTDSGLMKCQELMECYIMLCKAILYMPEIR